METSTYQKIIDILYPKTANELIIIAMPEVRDGLLWGKPRMGHAEGEVVYHVATIWDNIDRLSADVVDLDNFNPEIVEHEDIIAKPPDHEARTYPAAAPRGSDAWKKLRLIALLHDTFKYKVDRTQPRHGENHHAMRARRYAEKNFPTYYDAEMLDILELHDEAYNAWSKGDRDSDKWAKAEVRVCHLLERLKGGLDLYLMFYECDTHVGDHERPDLQWFKKWVRKLVL